MYIVDDDIALCHSLSSLIRSVGVEVKAFSQGKEFLSYEVPRLPSCLLLDVRLKGESGFSVYAQMLRHEIRIPVIFVTAYADVGMSVKAMKLGALDFLTKPFREQELLESVAKALDVDRSRLIAQQAAGRLRCMFASLTQRQREVMGLIVDGMATKQIASQLYLSGVTVKIHRRNLMTKMQAKSIADLVKKALKLGRG